MHIDVRHDPPAVRVVLQVVDHPVHLVHHALFVLVLHLHLVSVGFSDGTVGIRPTVPDVAVQVMDIAGLLLPDPQHFIGTAFDPGAPKRQCRKFPGQVVTVHHPEPLHRIGGGFVLPHRSYLLPFRAGAVVDDIPAHVYKYFIRVAHCDFLLHGSAMLYSIFSSARVTAATSFFVIPMVSRLSSFFRSVSIRFWISYAFSVR